MVQIHPLNSLQICKPEQPEEVFLVRLVLLIHRRDQECNPIRMALHSMRSEFNAVANHGNAARGDAFAAAKMDEPLLIGSDSAQTQRRLGIAPPAYIVAHRNETERC